MAIRSRFSTRDHSPINQIRYYHSRWPSSLPHSELHLLKRFSWQCSQLNVKLVLTLNFRMSSTAPVSRNPTGVQVPLSRSLSGFPRIWACTANPPLASATTRKLFYVHSFDRTACVTRTGRMQFVFKRLCVRPEIMEGN